MLGRNSRQQGLGRTVTNSFRNSGFDLHFSRRCGRFAKILSSPHKYVRRRACLPQKKASLPVSLTTKGYTFPQDHKVCADAQELARVCQNLFDQKADMLPDADVWPAPLIEYTQTPDGPMVNDSELLRPIIKLLSSDELLDFVTTYIGEAPVLGNINFRYADISEATIGGKSIHRDMNSDKRLHFIVLASDVDASAGPFTFLCKKESMEVSGKLQYQELSVPDEEFFRHVDPAAMIQFVGKMGDAMFVNPYHCFHYGARCEAKPRLMLIASYITQFSGQEERFAISRLVNRQELYDGSRNQKILLDL